MILSAPEPLADRHRFETFSSGEPSLDDWLKHRARKNQTAGASRTFVVCAADVVAGYYSLASGGIEIAATPGRFRRNMPEPIPIVILGRLAVDVGHRGRGLGRALFRDAAKRVLHASESIGIRGLIVHALTENAKAFYLALGLEPSPIDAMTLMATVPDLAASL